MKIIILIINLFSFLGCGIKGKPLPPLEQPVQVLVEPVIKSENLENKSEKTVNPVKSKPKKK